MKRRDFVFDFGKVAALSALPIKVGATPEPIPFAAVEETVKELSRTSLPIFEGLTFKVRSVKQDKILSENPEIIPAGDSPLDYQVVLNMPGEQCVPGDTYRIEAYSYLSKDECIAFVEIEDWHGELGVGDTLRLTGDFNFGLI